MKATGIIRRVDDLGRVVIPKEIRRTLKIREGDPMELWIEGDSVVFRKYSPVESLDKLFVRDVLQTLKNQGGNVRYFIVDRDRVIGRLSGFAGQNISAELDNYISTRNTMGFLGVPIPLCDNLPDTPIVKWVMPFLCDGDCLGALCVSYPPECQDGQGVSFPADKAAFAAALIAERMRE